MAAPAEVSKRCSNFRIRQFKEKLHYNIAANLTFNTTVSFVTLLIARTARIACADRHTHTHTYIHTHTHKTTTVTLSAHVRRGLMKTLKCKPSAQFAYNYTINVLSKCSNIISHRSSVFKGRHNDHRPSKVGTSIIHLRRSTHLSSILKGRHIDRRSSKVVTSIFEGRHIDLRRSKAETSHRQPNIVPTFQQFVTENCPQRRSIVIYTQDSELYA